MEKNDMIFYQQCKYLSQPVRSTRIHTHTKTNIVSWTSAVPFLRFGYENGQKCVIWKCFVQSCCSHSMSWYLVLMKRMQFTLLYKQTTTKIVLLTARWNASKKNKPVGDF